MTSRQQRTARRRGRPRIGDRRPTSDRPAVALASLPLPDAENALPTPSCPRCECGTLFLKPRKTCAVCNRPAPPEALPVPRKSGVLSENSTVKETAIRIYAMRMAELPEDQIAQTLGLSKASVRSYVYKAGRMGWLDEFLHEPRERLEYAVMHKVVRNLEEALDSSNELQTGMKERTAVALKIAEGALYPRLQQQQGSGTTNLMGIKIEIVGGEPAKMRDGTVIEAPAYTEGESS